MGSGGVKRLRNREFLIAHSFRYNITLMRPFLPLRALPTAAAALGVNAVPLLGWLRQTWTAETVMILYFLETVFVVALVGLLVRLAVPAADASGAPQAARRNELARDYWLVLGGFTLVCGVFIATILLLFRGVAVPWAAVGRALGVMAVLQLLGYGWEAFRLRPLDLADAETLVNRDMGRVAVLYFGVFIGMFLMMARPEWFVWPFVALKTVADVGALVGGTSDE